MILSRLYFVLLLLPAVLCSGGCSDDDIQQPEQHSSVLEFEAETQQRGPTTTLTIPDFKVTAYRQSEWGPEILMDNVTVTRMGLNSWVYSPPVEWPSGQKVDFYAVSPSWIKMNNNSWWEHIIPFSESEGVSTDLLIAVKKDAEETSGRLKLNFRHALARVVVKLRCVLPGLTVRVKSVALCNFADFGNFRFPHATTSPSTDNGDLYDCWQIYNTTGTYMEIFRATDGYIGINEEAQTVCEDLYFLPFQMKSLSNSASWEASLIEITYQVIDTETGRTLWPEEGLYRAAEIDIATATPEMRWVPGRSYEYIIDVGVPATRGEYSGKYSGEYSGKVVCHSETY